RTSCCGGRRRSRTEVGLGTAEMEKAFQLGASDDEIVAALQESQPILRERAIALAARHLAPETLGRFVGNDENAVLRNAALSALERQGPYAVPHLVSPSRGHNAEVAMFAVQILARIKDPASAQALLPLLEHADSNIAQAAIEALGALKAREAVPGLIRLLDADLWLQFAAVAALGEIGDPRAVQPLLDAIPNEMLSEPAVEALGRIASPEALPRLLAVIADHDRLPLRDGVLRACAAILETHPAPPSVFIRFRRKLDAERGEADLVPYLDGPTGVRAPSQGAVNAASRWIADRIDDALDDAHARVRNTKLRVVVKLEDVDDEEYLVHKLQDTDDAVRIEAIDLLVRKRS